MRATALAAQGRGRASWSRSAPTGARRCCARWPRRCASRRRATRSSPPTPPTWSAPRPRGSATPLVKRLGLDAGKLDGVCDGLEQLAAMPDLRRQDDAAPRAGRRPGARARHRAAGPARRRVRVAPRRAGADRRAGLEKRQRRAAQGRPRGAGDQPGAAPRVDPPRAAKPPASIRAPPCCWRGARTWPRCWPCTASSR